MRTFFRFLLVLSIISFVSCRNESQFSDSRTSNYEQKDFDKLPPLPNGEKLAKDPKFVSLLKTSGQFKNAVVGNANSSFAVGTGNGATLGCSLASGQQLLLVASVLSDKG